MVCVCSTNSPQMVVAMFGVLSIGAVVTGMNPALNPGRSMITLHVVSTHYLYRSHT